MDGTRTNFFTFWALPTIVLRHLNMQGVQTNIIRAHVAYLIWIICIRFSAAAYLIWFDLFVFCSYLIWFDLYSPILFVFVCYTAWSRGTTAPHATARHIAPARLRPRTDRVVGPRPCRRTSSLLIFLPLLCSLRSKLSRNADVAGSRLTLRITALAPTSNRGKTNDYMCR